MRVTALFAAATLTLLAALSRPAAAQRAIGSLESHARLPRRVGPAPCGSCGGGLWRNYSLALECDNDYASCA